MADVHLYPVFERLPAVSLVLGVDVFPVDKFPRLAEWTSAVQQLDFVRKVWISPKLYSHYMITNKAGNPDYDVEMDEETVAVQKSVA